MTCSKAKGLFSPYLDGRLTGAQMQALSGHLDECTGCHGQYTSLRRTQQLLSSVGRRKAPADLSLKLRLAISNEAAYKRRAFDGIVIRLQNAINSFAVPATAGLISAVAIFGFLMGFFALPLEAGKADVPLMFNTAPQLEQSQFQMSSDSISGDSLVIAAYIDSQGRVQDYRVLSNPDPLTDIPSPVKNMLIFSRFKPAMSMGSPTSGTAVLSFSKVSVKG
ncbi:MAG TPA: zf-HC2 domain-containing protein [Terriglobales bacterium]